MRSIGDAGRAIIWAIGFSALLAITLLVDTGDGWGFGGIAWLVATIVACVALGVAVPRWPVVILPILFAAAIGAISLIGYDGEDTPGMAIFFAELLLGAPWTLATMLTVGFRHA